MPVVLASDPEDPGAPPMLLAFPRRAADDVGGWAWDEVAVRRSRIEGYGLFTMSSAQLDWAALETEQRVALPFLGRETEVSCNEMSVIAAKVLRGDFVALPASELCPPPSGWAWATEGLFVEVADEASGLQAARRLPDCEEVLQVEMQRVVTPGEEASCVYLLAKAAAELLHVPEHLFALLKTHRRAHHTDRHFASHVVSYRRCHGAHMLINAHPCFANAAYALGTVNEPRHGESASLEIRLRRLVRALRAAKSARRQ